MKVAIMEIEQLQRHTICRVRVVLERVPGATGRGLGTHQLAL